MPIPPYAKLLVAVNGGAPESGGIDVPSAATLQFSAESTVGWRQQRWELYDYPEGFATPAGWTLAADGTVYSTDVTPSLVTLPANTSLWGGWAPRLKINEAVDDDATAVPNLVDATTALMMPSRKGRRDVLAGEGAQFTTPTTRHKGWARSVQRNNRAADMAKHVMPGHFDVEDYGAVADWNGSTGTDNLAAFQACLTAMAASGNRTHKLVLHGHYYLSGTLQIEQTIQIEGAGHNWVTGATPRNPGDRSYPGSKLVFAKNCHGLRFKSGATGDPGGQTCSAERSAVRNLTIACEDGTTTSGHGVYTTTIVTLDHVVIAGFGEDGFRATGYLESATSGNADGCSLHNVQSMQNKRDGFSFEGNDAQTCLISRCSAFANGRYGFLDVSRGNVYLMCHAEGNTSYDFYDKKPSGGGWNLYLGCYSEGQNSVFEGSSTVLGGNTIAPTGSASFGLSGGVAKAAPLIFDNLKGDAHVMAVHGESTSQTYNSVQEWLVCDTPGNVLDRLRVSYDATYKRWVVMSGSRPVAIYPTSLNTIDPPRWTMRHPNGVNVGSTGTPWDTACEINISAGTSVATGSPDNTTMNYEVGYVLLDAAPSVGSRLGRRCITAGSYPGFFGVLPAACTGSIGVGSDQLTLSSVSYLNVGAYLSIAGVTGRKRVVARASNVVTLDSVSDATVAGAAVTCCAPVFEDVFASTHRVDGVGTQAMADANQTPAASVYVCGTIKTTGAITADRDLTLPAATDAAARTYVINNTCTGAFGVVVKDGGAGTTVTVANGKSAMVLFDSRGVTRLTADV